MGYSFGMTQSGERKSPLSPLDPGLLSLLARIGFNPHESAVYLELLRSGEQPASAIARRTKTPRSTIRSILDKLAERGVVRKLYRRNTQYYSCNDPHSLQTHVEDTIEKEKECLAELEKVIPQMASLRGEQGMVPVVRVYEGERQVIEAFNRSLDAGAEEILLLTSYRFLSSPAIRRNDLKFYAPLRVQKKIRMRVISDESDEAAMFLKAAGHSLREHRFLPEGFSIPGNVHVYGRFVVWFAGGEGEHLAVLMESPVMAETMRLLFEFLWTQCRRATGA